MKSYKQRISLLEFLYRKPGITPPEVVEDPQALERLKRVVFAEPPRSKAQLRERVTALEVRNRELKEYAHMVAHDLKVPLTILIMTADLIRDVSDLTREESGECLQQIKSIAYEMNSIIDNLLLFAEVSKAEAPRGTVHMSRVVANVQARLSYMIREQQAQIILPQVWPDAIGYGPWIEEVWANYLSNALKHGGRPPRVELGASASPNDMLCFWTRDNGPGIPPEARTRLFTPFSQIGYRPSPGHGLGLPIVYNIVEKLGGQVGVESEVGQGSLFFFTLPAAA
ncbi:MAG: sensor histidine kinase [Chloroflexi bacterium]|nr:MAG: sensor histidine kinase [Chloroflexota bacterium]